MVLESLEPKQVWHIFEHVICAVPHPSDKEEKIRKKIIEFCINSAKSARINIEIIEDEFGNLLLRKAASIGHENDPPIILQAHMDMVCETNRPNGFEFEDFPIPVRIQVNEQWVDADGTTLGADDGIGVAIILALLFESDDNFSHGPLEILLTYSEETGLKGAFNLDPSQIPLHGKFLINLDGGNIGSVIIGCAGGGNSILSQKIVKSNDFDLSLQFLQLRVSGLLGGHSGGDIHLPRANAHLLLAQIMTEISKNSEFYLCSWNGGSMHNAINRESMISFGIPQKNLVKINDIIMAEVEKIKSYYQAGTFEVQFEPTMSFELIKTEQQPYMDIVTSKRIISSINIIPHGVYRFSSVIPGLVETSNNLAVIKTTQDTISVLNFTRSNNDNELEILRNKLAQIAEFGGWDFIREPAYSGWKPQPHNPFLQFVSKIYEEHIGRTVLQQAVHGGLECGVIGSKYSGMQMISLFPMVEGEHTPEERVNISSVGIIYSLLKKILTQISQI